MKNRYTLLKIILFFMIIFLGSVVHSNATYITTSAAGTGVSGTDENFVDDGYAYTFEIIKDTIYSTIFHASLENTSLNTEPLALIDLLAFNMDATLNTDFTIDNISPDWTFVSGSGGVEFNYVGYTTTSGDKIPPNGFLTFDFLFNDTFTFPVNPFLLWTDTESSLGKGIGGGEDLGQVAVSFQTLGSSGEDSDLLASVWTEGGGGGGGSPVPEPATFMLLGFGLLGLAGLGRKKRT